MGKIYNDVTAIVGGTPLVRLNQLDKDLPGNVAVKLEFYNPVSSVKDRLGIAIVDAAEASGQLTPGGTIVESTSGNTGIALAMVGAARGYRVILPMPASMSKERRTLLKAFGAELGQEIDLLRPRIVVALGATAARAVLGKGVTIGKVRGAAIPLENGAEAWVTVHPSFLLRIPAEERRREERARFVEDLTRIRDRAAALT